MDNIFVSLKTNISVRDIQYREYSYIRAFLARSRFTRHVCDLYLQVLTSSRLQSVTISPRSPPFLSAVHARKLVFDLLVTFKLYGDKYE